MNSQSVTPKPLIRVVNWSGYPHEGVPAWAELEIDSELWRGYRFRLEYADRELREIRITRATGSEPLTAHRFQRIPVGGLDRAFRVRVAELVAEISRSRLHPDPQPPDAGEVTDRDRLLLPLAQRYVETIGQRGQVAMLAMEFNYSKGTVPQMIKEARRRALLTPTVRGRAGGDLGTKARSMLGLSPSTPASPWDTASPEQIRRYEEGQAALSAALRAGEIDVDEFVERSALLAAELLANGLRY